MKCIKIFCDCWVVHREKQSGVAYQKLHEAKRSAVQQLEAAAAAQQQQSIAAAKTCRQKVKKHMAQSSAELSKNMAVCRDATDLNGRLRAVQALKESIRSIFMHIKSANELKRYALPYTHSVAVNSSDTSPVLNVTHHPLCRTKLQMKESAQSAQAAEFLALGVNPYERFRSETMKAAMAAENSKHEKIANQRKEQILKNLLLEEQAWGRSLKAAEVQKVETDEVPLAIPHCQGEGLPQCMQLNAGVRRAVPGQSRWICRGG
jgi:hypothetical protein